MELEEFYKGIELSAEAVKAVKSLCIPEADYQEKKELFRLDRNAFYKAVLREGDFRMRFLYYFSRMACETYKSYQEKEIGDKVYWDTFYDLTLWCEDCFSKYGEYGIDQYDWFFRHIEGRIFRLGRLEFEKTELEWDIKTEDIRIKKGVCVISVHVPQGGKLEPELVKESYGHALGFWGREYPYICHSWLLYPRLSEVLDGGSNIIKFQKPYLIVATSDREREAEERIFGSIRKDPMEYQEETRLQKMAKRYLLSGKTLGSGIGILQWPFAL